MFFITGICPFKLVGSRPQKKRRNLVDCGTKFQTQKRILMEVQSVEVSLASEKSFIDIVDPLLQKKIPEDPRPEREDAKLITTCPSCKVVFGLFTSKNYCSACGKVFCKPCSDNYLLLPDSFSYGDALKNCCLECFKKYNLVDFSRTYDEYGNPDVHLYFY